MFCGICGKKIKPGNLYCTSCGTKADIQDSDESPNIEVPQTANKMPVANRNNGFIYQTERAYVSYDKCEISEVAYNDVNYCYHSEDKHIVQLSPTCNRLTSEKEQEDDYESIFELFAEERDRYSGVNKVGFTGSLDDSDEHSFDRYRNEIEGH